MWNAKITLENVVKIGYCWYLVDTLLRSAPSAKRSIADVKLLVCLSIHPSVRDVEVLWSYKLGYFERNYVIN